jgi:hypothetical protein
MENNNTGLENPLLNEVKAYLTSEYGLSETDISPMHLILYEKLLEINGRVKKLEDHFLAPVIHADM